MTISDRDFDKTVHAFFSFNIGEPITLHQVQVMASLASRYTQINVLMKVHVGALYAFQQTFRSHSSCRKLTEGAHLEVLLWRAFLLSLSVNPTSFARPFQSFRVRPVSHTIEYDASLTAMGVLVWEGLTSTARAQYWGLLCYPHHSLRQRTPASRIRTNTLPYSSVFC